MLVVLMTPLSLDHVHSSEGPPPPPPPAPTADPEADTGSDPGTGDVKAPFLPGVTPLET